MLSSNITPIQMSMATVRTVTVEMLAIALYEITKSIKQAVEEFIKFQNEITSYF